MVELNEIRKGLEIGRNNKSDRYHKYIWQACKICGKQRWVAIRNRGPVRELCLGCACKNKIISEETREKYREAGRKKRGSRWSEERKANIRGENAYNWKEIGRAHV